jgi:hypothetical protein
MPRTRRFPKEILATLNNSKILGIKAGTKSHRFIGIWHVVVASRLFVRSWMLKPNGWYRTFLEDPQGAIQVGSRVNAIRAVQTRSESLKKAVDRAYAEKYNTPGSVKFVRGFRQVKRRDTTTELVSIHSTRSRKKST